MKHITDYLELEQVRTLLDSAQSCSTRDYFILRILFRTGVRVSELLNIRPQDLEPHNQVINIVKAKGNKQRRVIVDPQTMSLLLEYISDTNTPDNCPAFGLTRVQVWNIIKKYGRMINIDIHPHTFRHSFAIHLVRLGSMWQVQLLLGHTGIQTTTIYSQFNDQDLREGYNKIEF